MVECQVVGLAKGSITYSEPRTRVPCGVGKVFLDAAGTWDPTKTSKGIGGCLLSGEWIVLQWPGWRDHKYRQEA